MAQEFLHGVEVVEINDGIRPIRTPKSSVQLFVGTAPNADNDAFPLNSPVLVGGPRQAATLGAGGTLPDCYQASADQGVGLCIMVRVEENADQTAQLANVTGEAAAQTGVYAALSAAAAVGLKPRLLSAPGFTGVRPNDAANPVGAALKGVAAKLNAIAFVDAPDTTEADAIAAKNDYGSDRVYMIDPGVKIIGGVIRPASAYASAATAARDKARGFWHSPSNQPLAGIIGTTRPVDFSLNDPDSQANRLNEAGVATIIHANGFRLWGNRSTSADPQWAFLSVRRTADMIYEALEAELLYAMDRPISAQSVKEIMEGLRQYLRSLRARGAILGFKVWLDPELNTEDSLKAGELYVDFDIEPPAPLERLTFRAHRNGGYYEELIGAVASAA